MYLRAFRVLVGRPFLQVASCTGIFFLLDDLHKVDEHFCCYVQFHTAFAKLHLFQPFHSDDTPFDDLAGPDNDEILMQARKRLLKALNFGLPVTVKNNTQGSALDDGRGWGHARVWLGRRRTS